MKRSLVNSIKYLVCHPHPRLECVPYFVPKVFSIPPPPTTNPPTLPDTHITSAAEMKLKNDEKMEKMKENKAVN